MFCAVNAPLSAVNAPLCDVNTPLCAVNVAVVSQGVTLVVSPLISLMQDQCCGFKKKGIKADFLSSARSAKDKTKVSPSLSWIQTE